MLRFAFSCCLYALLILTPVSYATVKKPSKTPTAWDKKFYLKGLTITPGGFFAGEGVWRARSEVADMASSFINIPMGNSLLYYIPELRLSARATRLSALVEGFVNPAILVSGYVETDFIGNGTANSIESNSYDLRLRNAYATLDWIDRNWHLLAGQNWSLATTNMEGITPRKEIVPPTIDLQYVVGFVWKRQSQFRLVKQFSQAWWGGISLENPQTTFGGTPCDTVFGNEVLRQFCVAPGTHSLPLGTNFSFNKVPDVLAKLAFETPLMGHKFHIEAYGLYRNFLDRVEWTFNRLFNQSTSGYGIGGGGFFEIIPKLLDIQGNILGGKGIGSYAAGLLPDVTLGQDGSLSPIPEIIFMAGATLHATPKLDFYLFGGQEKESADYFQVANNFFGYGVPNAINVGCSHEFGICRGDVENLWQITVGLWDKFYQGDFGDFRAGIQYSYTKKQLFPGTGGLVNPIVPLGYQTDEQMVFFSLRYYPWTVVASGGK